MMRLALLLGFVWVVIAVGVAVGRAVNFVPEPPDLERTPPPPILAAEFDDPDEEDPEEQRARQKAGGMRIFEDGGPAPAPERASPRFPVPDIPSTVPAPSEPAAFPEAMPQ